MTNEPTHPEKQEEGAYFPEKPKLVCSNGHEYPAMAGVCPFCGDTPDASALDEEGNERVKVED